MRIYLGIDPDVHKSGFAIWDAETKEFDCVKNLSFFEIIEDFESWLIPIHVVIDAGWLIRKTSWHRSKNKRTAEKIAANVGANHQVGKLLAEYCERKNISYELRKPKGKVNSQIFRKYTGWQKRTNQDSRDAAMLVFQMKKRNGKR